ncbi:hypothetical protein LAZ67_1003276 [Cordylochernes scorpioides]|uniref:Transposase n=1 Tax=Cordylochernes scorpioides TaxID=51811 RepID=A0ABY6JWR0_9ARAC|nr:hypothetical protein LAZ67_1003276 [Cordylochernes scorpioides]
METFEALHWTQQQKIDMDTEQQLYTPKIEDIAVIEITEIPPLPVPSPDEKGGGGAVTSSLKNWAQLALLIGWLFGQGLDDNALAILASAKSSIHRFFLSLDMRGEHAYMLNLAIRSKQLKTAVCCVIARPYTAARIVETLKNLHFEVLTHPSYSPDIAPLDFHLLGPLKKALRGCKFISDEVVKEAVHPGSQLN